MSSPKNWPARRQHYFRYFRNRPSRAIDQSSPSNRQNADDPNGRKLDRADRRRHSVRLAVATSFATLNR